MTGRRGDRPLRGALVGCGYFARNHLHGWGEVEDVRIVAVCDLDADRARACAREFGVDAHYDDVDAMLAGEALDFVDIVTGPGAHGDLVARAAAAGLDVICQKPLAPNLAEARRAVAAAAGVTLMVHENFRWQRPMRLAARARREIGRLFFARFHFRSGFDVYADQPYLARDERFILYDLGVHLFDLARYFAGEITHLACHTARVDPRIRGEDVATALLRAESGAHVVVDLSYASKLERETFPRTLLHLEGSDGSVVLGADDRIVLTTARGTERIDAAPRRYAWSSEPGAVIQDGLVAIQRHWAACLRSGETPETSGRDNLRTLELTFAAYDAAARGVTIEIPPESTGESTGERAGGEP